MPRVLSQDLRERVVAAIDGGMSCRAAAARFGVSAASAIRWRQLVLQNGTPAAKPQGGDRRAGRIDAHGAFILAAVEAKDDITLVELQALLAAREAIEAAGATLLFLPPYSPDFNPIEQAFSKLKAHLRKAAERTIHGLWNAIGCILDLYPPEEWALLHIPCRSACMSKAPALGGRPKTRYRTRNWREYDRGLIARGDLTVWISPDLTWHAAEGTGRRGRPQVLTDAAIQAVLTLKVL